MHQGIPRNYLYTLRHSSNVETGILVLICIFFFTWGRNDPGAKSRVNGNDQSPNAELAVVDPIVFKLNLNEATASELSQLPRIGVKLSERIIEYRENNGEYQNLDALVNVKGIGPKTLDRLRPYCVVQPTSANHAPDVGEDSTSHDSAPESEKPEREDSKE